MRLEVRRDEAATLLVVADVDGVRRRVELPRRLLEPFHVSCSERERVPLLAQHAGDGEADPGRATGDEGAPHAAILSQTEAARPAAASAEHEGGKGEIRSVWPRKFAPLRGSPSGLLRSGRGEVVSTLGA